MADRFLKHIPSGHIFIYAPPWVGHEDFVEVADAAGNPFPDPEPEVNPPPKPRAKKAPAADPTVEDAAISADASRGLAAKGL
jgi:hypothetical protein